MRRFVFTATLWLGFSGLTGLACDTGDAAYPMSPSDAMAPLAIGPTPLRRLSNVEYLNALHDLFPTRNPTLPALPPDIPVAGFENAAEAQQASDVLIARYEAIANLYASAATREPDSVRELVGCSDWSTPTLATSCARQLLATTGTRIFRRPLSDDERSRFLLRFQGWQAAVDFEGAVELTLSTMLQSPQFLYRAEPEPRGIAARSAVPADPYAMATRLSFFLWESVPDDVLLDAAARDEIGTDEQIRGQAVRMLADVRAQRIFWDLPRQWLGLDRILLDEHTVRTSEVDPAWTAATQSSAVRETQLFVQNLLSQGGTFRDLMTSRRAWVNGEMARVYGLPAPADPTAWREVELPENERAGLLTRASFLAGYSHRGATSPPVRGNGIELRFLCQLPLSPPPNADLSQPTASPGEGPQTNRMLFETRTKPSMCQRCHVALNGFGFGLENYDAAGHYHVAERGLPVDASGIIRGTDVDGPFNGGVALSRALSKSETVHACATAALVRYALGRAPADVERASVTALAEGFMESGGDLHALLMAIATSPSFRMRLVEGGSP
jgi:hypothetical protein